MDHCGISSLDGFSDLEKTKYLILDDNNITNLKDLKNMNQLSSLSMNNNKITDLSDISEFERSLTPLTTLSTMAGWFLLVILIIGAIILVVLNIFNVRERKYEIGVLTAMGMKKHKVASQFICEILVVTMIAVIIGRRFYIWLRS